MPRQLSVISVALALFACGDNLKVPDAGNGVDAPDDSTNVAVDARPDGPPIEYPPGALVGVSLASRVGVLLDDFPVASRTRIATALTALPAAFWQDRARQQIRLATLRLIYREYYYPSASGRDSLPLTEPSEWTITLDTAGPQRMTIDTHDLVVIPYTMTTTILTDELSPGITEPALANIGGSWIESFVFPVDPTLIFQRTGYACMDEDQFPSESVDEENAWEFYDDECKVEKLGSQSCHLTLPLPNRTCLRAVRDEVGRVTANLRFERLPWDLAVANTVRRGQVTTQSAPDLSVVTTGPLSLSNNRIIYRYFPPGHCALVEQCVGGPGWRRLLAFDSYDHNVGGQPIHIGEVDYAVKGLGSELIDHNVFELSACHNHYHFEHYGDFTFGTGTPEINKNGFCLESTGRISNNELTPLHTPYSCDLQGVSAGWGDLYAAGLTCNWIDVTGVDTSAGTVTRDLQFVSNPDGFICEGTLKKDSNGDQVWEPTSFTAANGAPVDRPGCDETPGTEINDVGKVSVTLPQRGGMLTSACTDQQTLGPRRNCGFTAKSVMPCNPGSTVVVTCTGGSTAQPQVVRICEASRALGGGTDCVHRDAIANTVVEGVPAIITMTCPASRDSVETGGQIAIYTAPVYTPDGVSTVSCTTP